jgi:hypothetical protein
MNPYQKMKELSERHTLSDPSKAVETALEFISMEEEMLSLSALTEKAIRNDIAHNPSERSYYVETLSNSVTGMESALNLLRNNPKATSSMISRAQSCKSKAERLLNVARNC